MSRPAWRCECGQFGTQESDRYFRCHTPDCPVIAYYSPPRDQKPTERLVDMIRAAGLRVPDDWRFRRTYAGHWQRVGGAWSWYLCDKHGNEICGSHERVGDLVAAGQIEVARDRDRPPTIFGRTDRTHCE